MEIDKGWVNASKSAVEYTMDPRNFLNEVRIFQFEKLTYDPKINTKEGIEKILYGTEFYQRIVEYKTASGQNINTNLKYSDYIWDSSVYSGVSPYHLASRIKQEVGPFITHNSISGTVSGYEGLYNFYNIGATSSTEPLGAIKNGLQFARDGKGAAQEVQANLLIPWNTPERAIKGGAVFIGKNYILVGQNNLYLQKFDVNDDRDSNLFWHQYMTNCLAPYSESSGIYKAYSSNGMLESSIGFVIPVFENMPKYATESPNILASDYEADNKKMYADVTTTLNIRSGPSTSYEVLTSIDRNTIVTRIKKGIQSGERWDKIELENGLVGYVFQSYMKEVPEPTISKITLSIENSNIQKGSTATVNIKIEPESVQEKILWVSSDEDVATVQNGVIQAVSSGKAIITAKTRDGNISDSVEITVYTPVNAITISREDAKLRVGNKLQLYANVLPEDADDKNVKWTSSNEDIVYVDNKGIVTAKKEGEADILVVSSNSQISAKCHVKVLTKLSDDIVLEFLGNLRVEVDEITNLDVDHNTVAEITDLINTNLKLEFIGTDGNELDEESKIGTGTKLILKNENDEEIYQYTFIIYGDANGDGMINSLDVLVVQKHILETKLITGIYLRAANTSKNGNLPSSLDVLRIQKHILETKFIEQ